MFRETDHFTCEGGRNTGRPSGLLTLFAVEHTTFSASLRSGLAHGGQRARREEGQLVKVRPSVKPICEKCKVIKRRGAVMVICENPKHKQKQG